MNIKPGQLYQYRHYEDEIAVVICIDLERENHILIYDFEEQSYEDIWETHNFGNDPEDFNWVLISDV